MMISMLGDAAGNAPGGFLEIDSNFEISGRWEKSLDGMNFNYDFWYQPRHDVMISSEWAAPNTVKNGFKLEDVEVVSLGTICIFGTGQSVRLPSRLILVPME